MSLLLQLKNLFFLCTHLWTEMCVYASWSSTYRKQGNQSQMRCFLISLIMLNPCFVNRHKNKHLLMKKKCVVNCCPCSLCCVAVYVCMCWMTLDHSYKACLSYVRVARFFLYFITIRMWNWDWFFLMLTFVTTAHSVENHKMMPSKRYFAEICLGWHMSRGVKGENRTILQAEKNNTEQK